MESFRSKLKNLIETTIITNNDIKRRNKKFYKRFSEAHQKINNDVILLYNNYLIQKSYNNLKTNNIKRMSSNTNKSNNTLCELKKKNITINTNNHNYKISEENKMTDIYSSLKEFRRLNIIIETNSKYKQYFESNSFKSNYKIQKFRNNNKSQESLNNISNLLKTMNKIECIKKRNKEKIENKNMFSNKNKTKNDYLKNYRIKNKSKNMNLNRNKNKNIYICRLNSENLYEKIKKNSEKIEKENVKEGIRNILINKPPRKLINHLYCFDKNDYKTILPVSRLEEKKKFLISVDDKEKKFKKSKISFYELPYYNKNNNSNKYLNNDNYNYLYRRNNRSCCSLKINNFLYDGLKPTII